MTQNKKHPSHLKNQKIQELEKKLAEKIIETGLITNCKVHIGNLSSDQNYPYLEYRLTERNEQDRIKISECLKLKALIKRELQQNSYLLEFDQDNSLKSYGIFREKIRISPLPQKFEEAMFIERIISIIYKTLDQYNQRR